MAFVDTEQRSAGEVQQKVGRIRLSEAIRIGAKLRPQCKGWAFKNGQSCAWGAAWEGSGHPYEEHGSYAAILTSCPEWGDANMVMLEKHGNGIAMLNDDGATREQIADWLAAQGL